LIYYQLNKPWGKVMRLSIQVVDDFGQPVPDANVRGYFNDPRQHDDCGKIYNTTTDIDGICKNWGLVYTFTECSVTKNGYYSSRYYQRLKKDDKYKPNVTLVLKKIRNPIAMKVREVEFSLPSKDQYYPFDLDVGDLVEPYGKGKKANIYIYYYGKNKDFFTGKSIFRLKVLDSNTGLSLAKFDDYSQFKTEYSAPIQNYTNLLEFVSESTEDKQIIDTKIKKNEYIIFKCQNSTNSTMFNYGKILPDLFYWIENGQPKVKFTYYYNPVPDDRNLEFNPKKNLIDYSHIRERSRPTFKP
jgi:hypothetical protein